MAESYILRKGFEGLLKNMDYQLYLLYSLLQIAVLTFYMGSACSTKAEAHLVCYPLQRKG